MIQSPIIIVPPPIPVERDCVVVDAKRYCRDEDAALSSVFLMIAVGIILMAAWAIPAGVLLDKDFDSNAGWIKGLAWLVMFPAALAACVWFAGF